jgi:glutathione S-transferase
MILYGHDTSPYVRRVRVLLAELGAPFERDSRSWSVPDAEVLRINPMLRVPALIDGGQALLDSKLIAAYLYERYPASTPGPSGQLPLQATLFHPEHAYDDQNALLCIDAAADSAINVFLLELDGIPAEQSPYLLRQQQRLRSCLTWLDEKLKGRDTLHPGSFSFVDIAVTCALDWMRFRKRYPVEDHANLSRFLERHQDRPSLALTHPAKAQSTAMPKTPSAR